jgi:hypothetical protein
MENFDCVMCHNVKSSKMDNHNNIYLFIYWICINYAMWQNLITPHMSIS